MLQTDEDDVGGWLDMLPVLPLARGVPVVMARKHEGWPLRVATALGRDRYFEVVAASALVESDQPRVDLRDPQGFGYALRMLAQRSNGRHDDLVAKLANSWLFWPSVNDLDRVRLATALREVVDG